MQLTADSSVLVGTYPLTIRTSLGTSSVNIAVIPAVTVAPAVAIMAPGDTQSVSISLTATGNTDTIINLQTTDPGIASILPSTITLSAGQKNYTGAVTLTAIALGQTQLTLSSPDIISQSTPVYITPAYTLRLGSHDFYSPALGVIHKGGIPPGLIQQGPVYTLLGIQKGNTGGGYN